MTPIHVIGIGLTGGSGLQSHLHMLIDQATVLVGSERHLQYFPSHPGKRITLTNFAQGLEAIQQHLDQSPNPLVVVITSGDPLFFGFGRLLLQTFAADLLCFHPYLSSVQIAFNRLKVPWQDAEVISVHGRSLSSLVTAWQKGVRKIAVLTDHKNTPAAIAKLFLSLNLPIHYEFWVCENLEGSDERVQKFEPKTLLNQQFSALNVVVLLRYDLEKREKSDLASLPVLGLPDQAFYSFADRPGLMTKREIRILALAELQLQDHQIIWDIGSGTGSVAIETARIVPSSQVYAVEKTALGTQLIHQNCQHFQVNNVHIVLGEAPTALNNLPDPHRIFIGGSGGHLQEILNYCQMRLDLSGVIVVSLATLENFYIATQWFDKPNWVVEHLQIQLSRSVPVASMTRLTPLNPVMLIRASRNPN
ncbi:bifunctional cobalt-precorrin-7 (C(5))-methyltransferase/cobalt-precorrin-6B (C(15))-methyltransferase [Acaryochloris marina]|uniref:tRNA (guanine(46)-N(7))-methyltransferase n=1 Tax=Acaryochloris marina (strain MBIC 11017) TaxID=329726 RepID=B0C3F6_ACAM1|nr:bifunctional cobalt-precorrin-7 (C(5))-methyltransferase/cobalt-precorrin-6B (C(15))-methyltransferase [Acaryochloris marina]ABW28655.1 precorrin-6y C5,15-methyltransferase [Acaryochloris marina MBIC11017]BDM77650.1 precorrin-6Y C5,15-methyltransferase [Acaryochloris marina MBIC10699]